MDNYWGVNLNFDDFEKLLTRDDLVDEPVPIETFVRDKGYLALDFDLSDIQIEIVKHMSQIFYPHTVMQLMGESAGKKYYDTYTKNELVLQLGKGCHAPETPVFSARTGKWERLDSFTSPINAVAAYNNGKVGIEYATDCFLEGTGEMVELTTSFGLKEKIYIKHKYYTWKNKDFYKRNERKVRGPQWTEVQDIEIGDKIAIGLGYDVVEPQNIPIEHAKFIAYLLGDGMCPADHNPTINVDFGGGEPESLAEYLRCVEYIGSTFVFRKHLTKNMSYVRHGNNSEAVLLARKYGLWGKRANDKVVPDEIWACSNEVLKEFLGALWSTDGCIYMKNRKTSTTPVAEYCTISEQLAFDVQRILLRLGIPSTLRNRIPKYSYKGEKKDGQRAYYITVSNAENFLKFAETIPLLDYKRKKVEEGVSRIREFKYSQKMFERGLYWDRVKSIVPRGIGDYWTMTQPEGHNYVGNGLLSHQSGKDFTSRVSFCYIAHLLHCLRDPLNYYHKAYGVTIDLLNVAVNSQQAKNVFFVPLTKMLMHSPYFNSTAMFEPQQHQIQFFDRPIRFFSGHSEAEGWEGYELMIVVLDEISAFKIESELKGAHSTRAKGSADGIYNMSKASVISRFPSLGKVVCLSFPRFKGDFICERYDAAILGNEEGTWAIKHPTWEVNPTITREMLEPEFRRNPIEAESRFGCNPPEMEEGYFRDPQLVRQAFMHGDNPYNEDEGTFAEWFNGTDNIPRYIHVDLGLKRDQTGLAMVHCAGFKDIDTGFGVEKLPMVNVDFVHAWRAEVGSEISFSGVRDMIKYLSRKFTIAMVTFDLWASQDMIQILRSWGINTETHTVKKQDYDTIQTAIYDGRLRGYWNEKLVEHEFLKLRLINNTKVDHITSSEKDMADAVAGASFMCFSNLDLSLTSEIEIFMDDDDWDNDVTDKIRSVKEPEPLQMPADLEEWLMEMV